MPAAGNPSSRFNNADDKDEDEDEDDDGNDDDDAEDDDEVEVGKVLASDAKRDETAGRVGARDDDEVVVRVVVQVVVEVVVEAVEVVEVVVGAAFLDV